MFKLKNVICLGGVLFYSSTAVYAQSYHLFDVPSSTRSLSMGEAFTSIADDESSFTYNPAGIIQPKWTYISLAYGKSKYNYMHMMLSYTQPVSKNIPFSIALSTRAIVAPDQINNNPANNINFGFKTYGLMSYITLAGAIGKNNFFKLGTNLKFLHTQFQENSSYGGGIDIGALIEIPLFQIGILLQDVITVEHMVPLSKTHIQDVIMKLGISTRIPIFNDYWAVALQVDKNLSDATKKTIFRIGGYIRIWEKTKQKVKVNQSKTKKIKKNNTHNKKTPVKHHKQKKEFQEELFLNAGYGNNTISIGLTVKIAKIKMDFGFAFPELKWQTTQLYFNLAIPI